MCGASLFRPQMRRSVGASDSTRRGRPLGTRTLRRHGRSAHGADCKPNPPERGGMDRAGPFARIGESGRGVAPANGRVGGMQSAPRAPTEPCRPERAGPARGPAPWGVGDAVKLADDRGAPVGSGCWVAAKEGRSAASVASKRRGLIARRAKEKPSRSDNEKVRSETRGRNDKATLWQQSKEDRVMGYGGPGAPEINGSST